MILALVLGASPALAQSVIKGTVTDAEGEPLIGAGVVVKGRTMGVITDYDGVFNIQASEGQTLVVTSIGFKQQEVKAAQGMTVVMQEDNALLDEVVVIGYGEVKRGDVTTAVSSVSAKEISNQIGRAHV